jgi:hypothetical protein
MNEEEFSALITNIMNGEDLTDREEVMVQQCRSRMGREGAAKYWLRRWYLDITDEEIEYYIENDLSWSKRYVSDSFANTLLRQLHSHPSSSVSF